MDLYQMVADKLDDLGIDFKIVEHPAAETTEEADDFIAGHEGVRTKTMFLTNKKKTAYYLVIMDDAKRLDMNEFRDIVDTNRIKMASADSLMEKMKLPAGVVSPFGLLNNDDKDINVYFDQAIMNEEIMTFHPNVNTKTIFIKTEDLLKFLNEIGYEYHIVDL